MTTERESANAQAGHGSALLWTIIATTALILGVRVDDASPDQRIAKANAASNGNGNGNSNGLSPDLPVRVEHPKPKPNLRRGRALFRSRCASCHGRSGKGNGPTARHLMPKPANLAKGVYKIRSTPSGTTPTQEDLFRTITRGVPGTAMPGWKGLSVNDRWQLVYYLESLSRGFAKRRGKPIIIPEPLPATAQMIQRGRAIYQTLQCIQCHGVEGHGHGPGSKGLKDDAGNKIYPFDFSHSEKFKGGSTARDIYRTIHTGLDGTPMKSFHGMITDRDTWALVHYIRSLRMDRPRPPLVADNDRDTRARKLAAAVAAAKNARAAAAAARAVAEKAQADARSARAILEQMLAKQAAADRAAAEQAAKEAAAKAADAKAKADAAEARAEAAKKRRTLARQARRFFASRCAACHGIRGHADGPTAKALKPRPRDFSDPKWQRSVSNTRIERVILLGGPAIGKSPVMPPNPDLKDKPELVRELRRIVRGFRRR